MFGSKNKHARILKHHRNSAVYVDGRYLHVDTKVSTRSKRGRELARETAEAILQEVGATETAFERRQRNAESAASGGPVEKAEGETVSFDGPPADQGGFGDESDGRG